ncbi:HAD family hydrolase [Peptostreptococcus russellii]|uniref:HAD family hydrolase n=1 Tax=Peptostreptococcus russellii TaxID=215200 RepID=UPI002943B71A|nr:HAD family hydrolase [Peptostreptococcus russellii]
MIKHIFCDLDGTLYRDGITEKDKESIRLAQENGIMFHIATGRVYSHTVSIIEEADVKGYSICENGSFIYNNDGECIYRGTLDDMQINKIINLYNSLDYIEKNDDIIYFKYDGKIIVAVDGSAVEYFSRGYTVESDILERDTYNSAVGNIGILSNNHEKLEKLVEDFKAHFGSDFDIYISGPTTMNIVPRGVSKLEAIRIVCKRLGASLDEIMTIGDSPNDICMLRNIKMSFAMSDSKDSVKSEAGFETPSVADAVKMTIDFNNEMAGV